MNLHAEFAPVALSYIGALRGIAPRAIGEPFAYAVLNCVSPELLVCLAASNPDGRFYGLVTRMVDQALGEQLAKTRMVDNVTFLRATASDLLAATEKGAPLLPPLHYLCCDERTKPLAAVERAALFAVAEKILVPEGLFVTGYEAYDSDDGALRFLVRELAPEMDSKQTKEFLGEIKKLGPLYLGAHPELASWLDHAIAKGDADAFFATFGEGTVRSRAFDTLVALRPLGFTYIGDADIATNYIELSAPASAHQLIVESCDNPLYEVIKDFALNRRMRCDIWCNKPQMTGDLGKLFGGFAYGIPRARIEVPEKIETRDKSIDLTTPLFAKLIELMTLMPVTLGDFLTHPSGAGATAIDVIGAIQILVALGIAHPMRGHAEGIQPDLVSLRMRGDFNQYLSGAVITEADVLLASPIAGSAVAVSSREALVMQALSRAGLPQSATVLLPELQRLAGTGDQPGADAAIYMVKDIVSQSLVRWYAYGFLASAA